jgi:hypothetical protein
MKEPSSWSVRSSPHSGSSILGRKCSTSSTTARALAFTRKPASDVAGPLDHKIKLGVHHVEKAVQLGVRLLALKAVERAGPVNRGPGRDGGRGAWAAQSVEREAIS